MKNIVTLMNFVRGVEPRIEMDLLGCTKQQYKISLEKRLKTTFLLQYDAYILDEYVSLFKNPPEFIELGLWLEVMQPLVESVGIKWRGKEGWRWDYHCHCGMIIGYTDDEKMKIIDRAFSVFKDVFGFYPKTVGSWVLDSFSVEYMRKNYGIKAACICREQWGTDGYSLFGGYYNQGYYPAKKNILCPAQSLEQQITVPVFRLLGCDPVYQYDCYLWSDYDVYTLEPIGWGDSPAGGSNKKWVDWYLNELFLTGKGGAFAYAQTGQENSFGWKRMEQGYVYQTECLKKFSEEGKICLMKFSEAGEWYLNNFSFSPACTQTALTDWWGKGNQSFWYYSKYYRMNVLLTKNEAYIRDFFLYDENYPSRYGGNSVCETDSCVFDNLPLMNGVCWSDREKGVRAGFYFVDRDGNKLSPKAVSYAEKAEEARLTFSIGREKVCVEFFPEKVTIRTGDDVRLKRIIAKRLPDENEELLDEKKVRMTKNGYTYLVKILKGRIDGNDIIPENGEISCVLKG